MTPAATLVTASVAKIVGLMYTLILMSSKFYHQQYAEK